MRVLVTTTLLMMGEQSIVSAPVVAAHLRWSEESKVMAHLDHLRGRVASGLGSAAFTSRANFLKTWWEAVACEPPKMQAMVRGSWKPPAPHPGGDLRSFLVVEAEEAEQRCPKGAPHEATPSRRPCKAGPASGPHEADRANPSGSRVRPSVLHLSRLLDCSPDHCIRGIDRGTHLGEP